jgi:1-aminocyclopropane-1-carboxylate deaminase/D-cysteine desulfhydrase-like pyridoxal-dependent ACC family enzyme
VARGIVDQCRHANIKFDAIVHATSRGSTRAGLAVGLCRAAADTRIIGIGVNAMADQTGAVVRKIARQTARMLGIDPDPLKIEVRSSYSGEAYGVPTRSSRDAITMLAALESILVDSAYESKALAGLIDLVRHKEFGKNSSVVSSSGRNSEPYTPMRRCFSDAQQVWSAKCDLIG